jgi:hypothetical protein
MGTVFSQEYCHPTKEMYSDYVAAVKICKPELSKSECPSTCDFTNGVQLYPTTDFCGVRYMIPDVNLGTECAKLSSSQVYCMQNHNCNWYKGKKEGTND